MRVTLWIRTILTYCLLVLLARPAAAQFDTGSVVGTVRDPSGGVVPGATVTLTNTATGVSVTKSTSADGSYEFFTVRDGIYVITAEKPGFSIALVDNVKAQ